MDFKIKTSRLKKGLSIISHATASITTTPILENILIKVNYNNIVLTSNNLEMAIEYVIEEDVTIKQEGTLCIPSKLFSSYIGLTEDDEVNISSESDLSIVVKNNKSKMKFKGISHEEFPLIPNIKEEQKIEILGKTLKKAIEKTLFSTAEGNIRPNLAGIYIKTSKDKIYFASTDSYRLSEYVDQINSESENDFSCILPNKTANELRSIIEDNENIKIILSDKQIIFITKSAKIYSRLLNGKFPDYQNFFPNSFSTKAEINRIELINALRKINLLSKENNYCIKISFSAESGILIETNETQIGEGDINLEGNIEGENNIIGINSNYFLEALNAIESSYIEISFEGPLSQILIKPINEKSKQINFKHIIMPLKI